MPSADLTAYERISIQMELVVPLLRGLQEELGSEAVLDALQRRLDKRIAAAEKRAHTDLPAEQRLQATAEGFEYFGAGDILEYETVPSGADELSIDVTACGYARLMESLDATDLGHLLICREDHVLVAASGVELRRTRTCMQDDSHCDFRFRAADHDEETAEQSC